jgi:large subunit ribosomal protein L2
MNESFEDRSGLSRVKPKKSLLSAKKKSIGRDNLGHITSRRRGGGVKRLYRQISTLDQFVGQGAKVTTIEYDPNRTAHIALVEFENGTKKYIIAPEKLKVGDKIDCEDSASQTIGSRRKLKNIPAGTQIYDIEMRPGSKSRLARAAGVMATIQAIEEPYALLKLPSGETRKIHFESFASVGQVSNSEHSNIRIGRAGRVRKMNRRPSVRGKVMSPRSHPHGGGEGVNPIGLKYPKTPWGKVAIGKKTRRAKNSDKFIVKRAKKR